MKTVIIIGFTLQLILARPQNNNISVISQLSSGNALEQNITLSPNATDTMHNLDKDNSFPPTSNNSDFKDQITDKAIPLSSTIAHNKEDEQYGKNLNGSIQSLANNNSNTSSVDDRIGTPVIITIQG